MTLSASFPPSVREDARLLVLGSLPGTVSLAAGQYYAHPRNLFWRLMGEVLETDLVALRYADRLEKLMQRRIGLWDVVKSAHRPGSLDAAIRNPAPNDLAALAARLPDLHGIAFNGGAAYTIGHKQAPAGIPLIRLPSSSPAHAAMPYEAKRALWLGLRALL